MNLRSGRPEGALFRKTRNVPFGAAATQRRKPLCPNRSAFHPMHWYADLMFESKWVQKDEPGATETLYLLRTCPQSLSRNTSDKMERQ